MSAPEVVIRKTSLNAVKLRDGECREQCFNNSGEKIDLCKYLLRSRTSNATPNLCWVFCALFCVLCN